MPFFSSLRPVTAQGRKVARVLIFTFLLNTLVSAAKLLVGFISGALSLVADGVHSLLDALSNIAGLVGVTLASHPPDEDHPYGHRKFEIFAAMAISVLMGATCVEILRRVWGRLNHPGEALVEATPLSFGVMAFTLAVNAWVSWYERKKGKELQSPVLTADAAHTASDILASLTVLAALVGIRLGWLWMDPLACLVVVGIILRVAYGIVKQALDVLADHIVLDPAHVAGVVQQVPGVVSCHQVRSRGMPGHIFVDLHVQVPPDYDVNRSHAVTHSVMARVKKALPEVAEVFVHTEPATPEDYRRAGKKPPKAAVRAAKRYRRKKGVNGV